MADLLEQFNSLRSFYDRYSNIYTVAKDYGYPITTYISRFAQTSLFEHPDLTSIALLLVILYISFIFLVKAWRITIGK